MGAAAAGLELRGLNKTIPGLHVAHGPLAGQLGFEYKTVNLGSKQLSGNVFSQFGTVPLFLP